MRLHSENENLLGFSSEKTDEQYDPFRYRLAKVITVVIIVLCSLAALLIIIEKNH
jgi:hypothetical protein